MKKTVVIGFLGNVLDFRSRGAKRWEKWRPSISLCMQDSLNVDRFELLHHREDNRLAHNTASDMPTYPDPTTVTFTFSDMSHRVKNTLTIDKRPYQALVSSHNVVGTL